MIEIFLLFLSLYLNYIELECLKKKFQKIRKNFDSFNTFTAEIPLFLSVRNDNLKMTTCANPILTTLSLG
ncbi:MAG: hypothetical protein CSA33_05415 [Desulfobulbus propionicus]|nr:MAG: hypothetical protein CSA33_05415 [Desulfobulbus propionicus]